MDGTTPAPGSAPHEPTPAGWSPAPGSPATHGELRGDHAPVAARGPLAIVDALLKSPASVLHDVRHRRGALVRLSLLVVATMLLSGVVLASWSGGLQLLIVPLKLALGIFFAALICLPSLYIFSCLAGAEQSLRDTWGALLMGVALMGVLLVGLAPVAWVFSQATSSAAFMGAMHLAFLLFAASLGIGLVRRALASMNGGRASYTTVWGLLFLLVLLQLATTLRPLVGPWDGALLHERQFFLVHWLSSLVS